MPILLYSYLLLVLLSALLCGFLAYYAWQRPHILGARFLALCLLAIVETLLAFLGLSLANSPEIGFFWAKIRFLGLAFAAYFFWLFVLEYSAWQIPKWLIMLLGIPSIITQFIVWAFPESFFFVDWRLVDLGILRIDVNAYQGWFNVHLAFAQGFLLTAFFRLVYYAFHVDSGKRPATLVIIFGTIVALIFSLPMLNRPEWMLPKLTPIGFGVMGLSMAYALLRLEFLRVIPIAYDVVFQNIRASVIILNPEKRILQVNPYLESSLSVEAKTLLMMPIAEVFQKYFGQEFPTTLPNDCVWEFRQEKDAKIYHYEASISQLHRTTVFLGYLLTLRDVSIYKEAESQALALQMEQERVRLLHEFITYTSHDLRNPLATINSAVYILQKGVDENKRRQILERIKEQSDQIEKILGQFYSFIQLEEKNLQTNPEKLQVCELLEQKAAKYRPIFEQHKIHFHFQAPPENLFIMVDRDYLRQALQALLDNAILYNQAQGEVWFGAEAQAEKLLITVRDTGIGIAPETLAQIFESFYKGNAARSSDGSGAGLGLPLVQRVAKLYNGDIQIESAVGKGTTVRLILPLLLAD